MAVFACCVSACLLGCELGGPSSGRGLHLPAGDLERGEIAFRELGCRNCHFVAGEAPPPKRADGQPRLELGGDVRHIETHGQLVTSIINPSHEISKRLPADQTQESGRSRMPPINEKMTVSQLIDLTTYLQSKYELIHDPVYVR
jgi:hypothetical protein